MILVESFGRLGEEGYEFIDELATHTAEGRDGGSMALRERRFQGTTSSSNLGGYTTGGHIAKSPTIDTTSWRSADDKKRKEAQDQPHTYRQRAMIWVHSVDEQ